MGEMGFITKKVAGFGLKLNARGLHVAYHGNETNRCPGCGRGHWYVGRVTAECAFCGTAVAIAASSASSPWTGRSRWSQTTLSNADEVGRLIEDAADQRVHDRVNADGRVLELLIGEAGSAFPLRNISRGGVMGVAQFKLPPLTRVQLLLETGELVPGLTRWSEGPLVGISFESTCLPISAAVAPTGLPPHKQ